jgi:two-component system, chemotaxis family, sensor kinase CheA
MTSPEFLSCLDSVAAELVHIDEWSAGGVAKLRHALENLMMAEEIEPVDAEFVSHLLSELTHPAQGPGALAASAALVGRLRDGGTRPAPTASPGLPQAGDGTPKVTRDEETLSLLGQFFDEARDALEEADETLMAVAADVATTEHVHQLFRVFHSIKGVAACVDVLEMARLAHSAESLLDRVRDGALKLDGEPLELAFEATAQLALLLRVSRQAVEAGEAFPVSASIDGVIRRLHLAVEGAQAVALPSTSSPSPEPVIAGDVLVSQPPAASAPPGLELETNAAPPGQSAPARDGVDPSPTESDEKRGHAKLRETLKVDLERVESVVEMIGELIIVESMVANLPEIVALESPRVQSHLAQLTKISRDLQAVSMRMRMVPVRNVFQKMARLVRDLSKQVGKKAVLVMVGEGTEMDRGMVDRLEEPLLHMVRNSMDHGIELPQERALSGKPEVATIELSAAHEGGNVVVRLKDDGRGLNRIAILEKARARGVVDASTHLSETEVNDLIFAPGFSTAAQVTALSGRGVGMDVVKRSIEALRGHVITESEPGKGTSFRLVLPLTLAVIDGMLVSCAGERYVLPSLSVVESLRPNADMIRTMATKDEYLLLRGDLVPLIRAASLFRLQERRTDASTGLAVVLESMGRRIAVLVDDVLAQQQFVIKPLQSGYTDAEWFSGAAILSDGRVGLIVNVDRLGQLAVRKPRRLENQKPEGTNAHAA